MSKWSESWVVFNYEQPNYSDDTIASSSKNDDILLSSKTMGDSHSNVNETNNGKLKDVASSGSESLRSYHNKKFHPIKRTKLNVVCNTLEEPRGNNAEMEIRGSPTHYRGHSPSEISQLEDLCLCTKKISNTEQDVLYLNKTPSHVVTDEAQLTLPSHSIVFKKDKREWNNTSNSDNPNSEKFKTFISKFESNGNINTTVVPITDKCVKQVTKNDPNVKKLVYNTYRNLLSSYNNKANQMISALPRNKVEVDQGVSKQIESITQGVVPPPPFPGATGHIPASKLKTEVADRRVEPPLCVQNAMLTKDKKPFTYTPGGLDLSEIRSPRMAKRLERNAMSEGVSPAFQQQPHCQGNRTLPPSALAAMQPQLPVQVFPSGKIPRLNQTHQNGATAAPPPPPPPPLSITSKAPLTINSNKSLPTDSFDRPDMTKIIPENPMALLRKTQGPIVKQDPIFNKENYSKDKDYSNFSSNSLQNRNENIELQSLDLNSYNKNKNAGVGTIYVPPLNQNINLQSSPCSKATSKILNTTVDNSSHDVGQPHSFCKNQQSISCAESPSLQIDISRQTSINSNARSPESPRELLTKAPAPWMTQKRIQEDLPEWVNKDTPFPSSSVAYNDGSSELFQHQGASGSSVTLPQAYNWRQNRAQPPIREYQQQQSFQNELPSRIIAPQNVNKGERELKINGDNLYKPIDGVEVVIVNDPPPVFYHPGQPRYNDRSPKISNKQDCAIPNVRIIPINVEGTNNGSTSSNDSSMRTFHRQQSWSSNPTQSNTFKVLQKITQTDGDDFDNMPICEHSPKSTNKFPQRQLSAEQFKKAENLPNFNTQYNTEQSRGSQVRTIPIQLEGNSSNGYNVPVSEQIVREPKKYTGSSIPSRSFKILQAMTSPEQCASVDDENENKQIFSNVPTSNSEWQCNSNYPISPYYYHPYWAPYSYDYSNERLANENASPWKYLNSAATNVNTDNESRTKHRLTPVPHSYFLNQKNKRLKKKPLSRSKNEPPFCAQYPPFWDPYAYGYYYGVAPPLCPIPFYSESDNDEISGYSSTDEMSYYASSPGFNRGRNNNINIINKVEESVIDETTNKLKNEIDDDTSVAETSDSDSEMTGYEVCKKSLGLQTIRSVSNINIYDEGETSEEEQEQEYDNSDEETNDTLSVRSGEDAIPHQLSVIYEESEQIDNDVRFSREGSVSTTVCEDTETVENNEYNEEFSGTVSVKLPLRLNFVVNKNEKVATITVGDSQIVDHNNINTVKNTIQKNEDFSLPCIRDNEENMEVDWWGQLNEDNECLSTFLELEGEALDTPASKSFKSEDRDVEHSCNFNNEQFDTNENEVDFWAEIINTRKCTQTFRNENVNCAGDTKSNSLSSRSSSCSRSQNWDADALRETTNLRDDFLESVKKLDDSKIEQELQHAIRATAKDGVNAIIENNHSQKDFSKFNSRKSSVKSQEDCSEEDYDSGVTSDIGKHISEIEKDFTDFTEAKKVYQYQRVATHSRLFKLLQEECENEQVETNTNNYSINNQREGLDLSLSKNNETDSFHSSGFNSPGSPTINNRFVNDLIQSLLKNEQMVYKNVTMDKIQAAALKILQEDNMEENMSFAEDCSSFLSSKNCCTESSTPAQTPQEFYCNFNDYSQYYDSWADPSNFAETNILPSKAFRLIQAHAASNKTGAVTGLLARCPRVLSNKNVQKELMRLIETQKSPSPDPTEPVLDANEATNAP